MENHRNDYDILIENIEFENITLVRSSVTCYKMVQERNNSAPEKANKANVQLKFSTKEFDVLGGIFFVPVTFQVEATIDDHEKLFSIEFEMILYYSLKDINSLDDKRKLLEKFIENNVPINFWPYAREYVSDLTMRMGFPPLYIPMFKQYNR